MTLSAVDDLETESSEEFRFLLLDVINDAAIGQNDSSIITGAFWDKIKVFFWANIIFSLVLKSDYANGLFGFSRACEPENIEEGGNATCYIKRTRGIDGMVTVTWKAQPLDLSKENMEEQDFIHNHGQVDFGAGQIEAVSTPTLLPVGL